MPSTVYKGDLSEISFGHESGMKLTHNYSSSFVFTAKASGTWASDETSIIEFSGGAANTPCNSGILEYPIGMLVGAKLCFHGMTETAGNRFYADDNASNGSIFTIVKHAVVGGKTQLTIHPRLKTNHTNDCPSAAVAEIIEILPYTAPSMDVAMTYAANANASAERVLTDQFVGIMNVIALPETKVDLKRYHVVGLGRDVAVQVPGRFTNVGGSFEHNLHNSRWLYYALGNEVVNITGEIGGANFLLNGAVEAGASRITYDGGSAAPTISGNIGAGDYVVIEATSDDDIDINSYREETTNGIFPTVGASNIITKARPEEVRRIVAIHDSSGSGTIWLDGPLNFSHPDNRPIKFIKYLADNSTSSPHRESSGNLQNPVSKLIFSKSHLPSFSLETSIRRRDIDSSEVIEATDGGATDSKQLTRVFRGCKVKDFVLTADNDAALRMTVNFDAALCYTDTGRLEGSNAGDRYDIHRLFEETAETDIKRKKSGIEKGTQKPFMFYNGTIKVAGQTLGQVISFTLNAKTGVEQHYVINGSNIVDAATDQVPFAGSRNPSLSIEGKTEYELDMEIVVDDPVFYHNMRRAVHNFDETTTDTTDADMIQLSFLKQGTGATRESIDIVTDDYYIVEAPLPIPEDKGAIRATLKIMPKNIRVLATDTVLHS
mgnify:FL=1|tara:strand:+ start:1587 stop:3569 length:1983 start_codon:yes stop_codon:yes gene_type:complete